MTKTTTLVGIYLKSLGYIFAIAFLSYYAQYPALSSRSGVEPSEGKFRNAFPRLYHHVVESSRCDADSFVELISVMGVVLSTAIASGVALHGSLFIAVVSIYHFLVKLGDTFYSFQWDILLIETGFFTAISLAPWRSLTLETCKRTQAQHEVGSWPIRFLLFKLMFMSGVVKIQANCPTWQNLTALEYHFATQCLPGPLAWYAHQLHPLILRLGVAATFVIEIPAAFLLISPFVTMRMVGAWMQIILQVLIILTGSYNFFNLLTICLAIPCMIGDEPREKAGYRRSPAPQMLQWAVCASFLAWACKEMFTTSYVEDPSDSGRQMIWLKLAVSKDQCNNIVERTTPIAVTCALVFTLMSGVRSTMKKQSYLSSSVHTLICCLCIATAAVPLVDLYPRMYQPTLWGVQLNRSTWRNIRIHSSKISHGYGLFRRMTGVGQQQQSIDSPAGWAGLPPSIVARPEIILEAMIDDSEEWRELNFRWKPGALNQRPLQAAPHQPRFDGRMWFAALGEILTKNRIGLCPAHFSSCES
ncbi:hypothetical protein ACHAWF_015627 [Thalassiosira exigua]